MSRLIFHRLAEFELNDAAQYYERESVGLGAAFLAAVERCTESVLEFPESGMVLRKGLRRRRVPGFPYGLFYRLVAGRVRVLAVANEKRRPFYWADPR